MHRTRQSINLTNRLRIKPHLRMGLQKMFWRIGRRWYFVLHPAALPNARVKRGTMLILYHHVTEIADKIRVWIQHGRSFFVMNTAVDLKFGPKKHR